MIWRGWLKRQVLWILDRLDSARQMVIMGMIFNMGNRFDQFKKMIAALEVGDYQRPPLR